jgi:hypothetical protein
MLINGSWYVCDDNVLRPVIRVDVMAANGEWIPAPFLVDTGADRTVLNADVWRRLGLAADQPAVELGGLGGTTDSVYAETQLRFTEMGGGNVFFRGRITAVTVLEALDTSVLGRDILNLFALIVDRPRDVVCLLGQRHSYKIEQQ